MLAWALFAMGPASWAMGAEGPRWTIGRAQIVGSPRETVGRAGLYLELSLRNTGALRRAPVRIFGRWRRVNPHPQRRTARDGAAQAWRGTPGATAWRPRPPVSGGGRRWLSGPGPTEEERRAGGAGQARWTLPAGMRLLGRYRSDLSLGYTAILRVPLAALGPAPGSAPVVDVAVMTGVVVTDRRFVGVGME